jgi:hypothetical protein
MGYVFWIKRFVVAAVAAFAILTLVELLKGHDLASALWFAFGWGVLASALFTGTRIYRSRKGQACAVCNDTPEPKP